MNRNDAPEQQMQAVPVTDPQGYCPIRSTLAWFAAANQFDGKEANVRQVSMSTGCQMKVLADKLEYFLGRNDPLVAMLQATHAGFRVGDYDAAVEFSLRGEAEVLLALDLMAIWHAIAAAGAQGADVAPAFRAVGAHKWSLLRQKPANWPALHPFTANGRRG